MLPNPLKTALFSVFQVGDTKRCLLLEMASNASNSSMIAVHQCKVLAISFPTHDLGPTWYITLAVLNSCLIFPTVFLNLIILVAIQKTPSIHSPSFILFAGLVICLLLAAISIEPLFVGFTLARLFEKWSKICVLEKIALTLYLLFGGSSRFVVIVLAFDRFLAVYLDARYKYVVTLKRSIILLIFNLFLNATISVLVMWFQVFILHVVTILAGLDFVLSSSLHLAIWFALRARTKRIFMNKQGGYSPTLNFFKRSLHTSTCIAGASLSCHLPLCASVIILSTAERLTREKLYFVLIARVFVNLSFFIIPATAVWKMSRLRKAVKNILDSHLPCFFKFGQNQIMVADSHNISLRHSNKPLKPRIEFAYHNKAVRMEMEELRLVSLGNLKKVRNQDVRNTVSFISMRSLSQNADFIEERRVCDYSNITSDEGGVYGSINNMCTESIEHEVMRAPGMTPTAFSQFRRHSAPLFQNKHKVFSKIKRKFRSCSLDEVSRRRPEGLKTL